MSIARHHAEWLSLVPVSGPFLSLPVLMEAFPQGLDAPDPEHARLLRLAYEEWDDSFQKKKVDPSVHDACIRFVLTKTLEYDESLLAEGQAIPQTLQVEVPEHGELLKPSIVLNDLATNNPRMLIQKYPRSQDLSSYVAGSRWKASPDTRMTDLLHATGVRLGLVTNGEHWMLVDAPKGETTGYASWYASLWREEKITLQAFRSLLSMYRLFGVAEGETLEALLTKSASNQQEVTDQLGLQVRRAVEVLIQSLDKADQDHGRELLEGVSEAVLYESALTVMMRLVFLFCAEERELIPTKPFPVYEQNYSVSTISKQLREIADQQGEELLERRFDAWPRLLSAFRAVYGGLAHDDVYMPAYGGRLFDPDRFPFLEGRKSKTTWRDSEATPLPVNNRTVLHLLEALQLLQVKVPGGGPAEARRLSFRALDIEQIGHVYEGLLDHTAKRAAEPFLGLAGNKGKEPEISLSDLETQREKGDDVLLKYLKEETGRLPSSLEKGLNAELDAQQIARFRTACQSEELWERVEPFVGLIRNDTFGYPVVIPKGSVFVTAGTDRRSSGTHYTPRSLTEPIVQYTLEPLVYIGPAEGKPKSEWKLKSAADLLDLKICDMACGSGAFLVQAARYMSERLMEAWDDAKKANPSSPGITPEGKPSTGKPNESLIPDDPAERTTYAMRIVAQRCLYGVDINPLAAEMAKLSLWLLTLAKDKPFEFLDHAIRCGDSLVGLHDIDQLRHFSLKPDADDAVLFGGPFEEAVEHAIQLRLKLEDMPSNTVEDVEAQEKLLKEADDKIARLRCAADLLVAAEFWGEDARDKQERVRHFANVSGHYVEHGPTEEFEQKAQKERRGQKMFHWPLEFPEVIVNRGGFDVFIGNPPFMGGSKITGNLGVEYRTLLLTCIAADTKGSADLCAYFLLRGAILTRVAGGIGFVTTNTIAQGDTREVGISQLLKRGWYIYHAVSSEKWPGQANLEIARLWVAYRRWLGVSVLDGFATNGITSWLTQEEEVVGQPQRLVSNAESSFLGSKTSGMGFVLSRSEAEALLAKAASNREVLQPFLNGAEFNSSPTHEGSRWVIFFRNWSLSDAERYPECLAIVRERVKPERDKNPRKFRRDHWWLFGEPTPGLYAAIGDLERVLVRSRVSNINSMAFVSPDQVFSEAMVVFATDDFGMFATLQSALHTEWVNMYASSMRTDIRYTPSDCYETFPLPTMSEALRVTGSRCHTFRSQVMRNRSEGLTKTYNRCHDQSEMSEDIQKLRTIHVEMDNSVAAAYGWDDLDLGHDFHETKQGLRFTISDSARREVLQRLLKLNHERYAEEVKQGLHAKANAKSKPTSKKPSKKASPVLFDLDADDSASHSQQKSFADSIGDVRQQLLCGFAVNVFFVAPGLRWNEYADLFAQATVARVTANRFADRLEQAKTLRKALPTEFKQPITPDEWSRLQEQLLAHSLIKPFSETDGLVHLGPDAASFSLGEPPDQALSGYAQLMVGICLRRMDRLPSNQEQQVKEDAVDKESAQPREART
jgi:hypothetical protein